MVFLVALYFYELFLSYHCHINKIYMWHSAVIVSTKPYTCRMVWVLYKTLYRDIERIYYIFSLIHIFPPHISLVRRSIIIVLLSFYHHHIHPKLRLRDDAKRFNFIVDYRTSNYTFPSGLSCMISKIKFIWNQI